MWPCKDAGFSPREMGRLWGFEGRRHSRLWLSPDPWAPVLSMDPKESRWGTQRSN